MTAGAVAVPTIVPLRAPQPGRSKLAIDSQTKIEIKSVSNGAEIYYTLNGTKPDPFQPLCSGERHTLKYTHPISLPAGKCTVKSVAVSKDGVRESLVVTKSFDVEYVPPEIGPEQVDDDLTFQDDMDGGYKFNARKHAKSLMTKLLQSNQAWADMSKVNKKGSNYRKPTTGARFTDGRMGGNISNKSTFGDSSTKDLFSEPRAEEIDPYTKKDPRRMPPDSATQALRLQRETDFLKCIYCFQPRPSDPYARFCDHCGSPVPPLPQSRIPPPESGQIGMCVHCHSMVPFNVPNCLICEAPIPPQNQPQASLKLMDKLLCVMCGTENPPTLNSCITCEAKLQTNSRPIHYGSSAPPVPTNHGRLLTCTKCSRVNNSDARYCDWCGAKPSTQAHSLKCSKCSATNQPLSHYCASCGALMEPPRRQDVRNSGVTVNLNEIVGNMTNGVTNQAQWLPVSFPLPGETRPLMCDQATQTVGLFYTSSKGISKKVTEEEEKVAYEKMMRDRKPLLTTVSPGRGYWRKQIDHICAHIRAHASNDPEFRALIGEPRMGKLISTTVEEDGYEVNVGINFALRGSKDPYTGKSLSLSNGNFLSTLTEGRRGSLDSFRSNATQDSQASGKRTRRKKKVKKQVKKEDDEETKLNKALVKECGRNGEGNPSEVQQILDEGADPKKAKNKDGYPVLIWCVKNKHNDAIPILVEGGADVNEKGPQKGNTALHEAVLLGHEGRTIITTLLSCGASQKKKNDRGETAYDLAVKNNYTDLVKTFASSLGKDQLSKMIMPKSLDDDLVI